MSERVYLDEIPTIPDLGTLAEGTLDVATLEEFVAIEEPGAASLLGDPDEVLIPENGDVMIYGDGGVGKTTLCIDAAFHLAAGAPWLGIPVARPIRILLVENEGPRPLFRRKLRRKRDNWNGDPVDERLLIVEVPWAELSFADQNAQQLLAQTIRQHTIDLVIAGPVTRSGMNEAGTLQQIREFMDLVAQVRKLASRPVTFLLVHHENKGGQVSGAWEGSGDTLLHVQGQGNGRTRLHVQKARWSSKYHATALNLIWADGESFVLDEARIRDLEQELTEAFTSDNRWRTARESAGLIGANQDHVRDSLATLVERGIFTFQIGPAGRKANAKCWQLRSDSEAPSHNESLTLLGGAAEGSDSLPLPIEEGAESESLHQHPTTDSEPPSHFTQNGDRGEWWKT